MTQVVNDLVNGAGMTFWPRLSGETGASAAELTRANFVAREIFGSLPMRRDLMAFDNLLPAEVQTRMRLEMRTLVERASRWLVNNRRPPMDSQATVDQFAGPLQKVMAELPDLMTGRELAAYRDRQARLVADGVPEDLASRVAVLPTAYMLLGVIETAAREEHGPRRRGPGALRARRAARAARPDPADPGAAARRPLADDGPCRAARRPARRPQPADRAGARGDVARGLGAGAGSRPGRTPTT